MKRITLLLIVLTAVTTLQAQLVFKGEYRPRTEFLHGWRSPMANQGEMFNLATTHRARLDFGYTGNRLKFGMQVQDVRAWGSTKQLVTGDGAYTSVHQAWAEFMVNDNFSVKIGRQEVNLDDQRIFGAVNWTQQARSHDMVLFKYGKKDAFDLKFGLAVNQVQTRAYNVAGNYKSMQFLWFHKDFGAYKLSILALNNGVNDTTLNNGTGSAMTTYSQIIGQRSVYKSGKFSLGFNFYYQMGKDKGVYYDKTDKLFHHKNYSAINFRLDLGYKLNDNWAVGAGYEYMSGNSQTDTTTEYNRVNHAFMPLYGTNHKFNGWMDYFYVGNHANSVGLGDAFITIKYKKDKFFAGATHHFFSASADVLDWDEFLASGGTKYTAMPSSFGMELDTWMGYKFAPHVTFKAGLSGMFDSATLRAIKGGSYGASNYWGWVMMVFNPTFLNQ